MTKTRLPSVLAGSFVKLENSRWYNVITREIDNHLKPEAREFRKQMPELWRSYMMMPHCVDGTRRPGDPNYEQAYRSYIRVPGATRGQVLLIRTPYPPDGTVYYRVQGFEFYEETCFSEKLGIYERSLEEAVKRFIGSEVLFVI